MQLSPEISTVFRLLEKAGFEAYLVGGAVRDFVRDGSPAKDWDVTTGATPEEVKEVFSSFRLIETGLKHGTVTVLVDGIPVEITTFRIDGDYTDHRHPDSVTFTRSLAEDLARRDFTVNALAYNPKTGITDLWGGREDLKQNLIRCVGDPDRRFREDALRILRGLRFASVYAMDIEEGTKAAIFRNKELLGGIAPERIRTELTGLLCGKAAGRVLEEFSAVIAVPLPELAPMFGFLQHNPHHDKDIWHHTTAVVSAISPVPVLRWSALLHDVGKPHCFAMGKDGFGHFYGHARHSAALAEEMLTRLRFDNAGKERILRLVRHHDLPITPDAKLVKRLLNKHGVEAARQLIELHRADTLGQAPRCRPRLELFAQVLDLMDELLEEDACFSLRDLAINGHDLMELGLSGAQIGQALELCLAAVMDERIENRKEALLEFAKGII